MLAGAHVADGTGLLAVTGETGSGQRVERSSLGAAAEVRLAHAGASVQALERSDVEILARMRARHDRDLGRFEIELLLPAGLEKGNDAERLHRRTKGDDPVGIAELVDDPAGGIGLDDVATVDALLDPVPEMAHEDRCRGLPSAGRAGLTGWRASGAVRCGGAGLDGHDAGLRVGQGLDGGRRGYRDGCYDGRPRVRPPPGGSELSMPTPNLHVSQHPAVLHKLAILRDENTEPKKFREVVRELSWLLGYEALADVGVRPREIRTPMEPMTAHELGERVGFVPILRAGLGMVDAMLELMPTAQVWHLGLFRDERTLRPVEYYNKLPDSATVDLCLILDPMLATGGSATAAIEVLKKWGAVRIKLVNLIAAPEGVEAVTTAHPDVAIYCAALTAGSTSVATSSRASATPATASSGRAGRLRTAHGEAPCRMRSRGLTDLSTARSGRPTRRSRAPGLGLAFVASRLAGSAPPSASKSMPVCSRATCGCWRSSAAPSTSTLGIRRSSHPGSHHAQSPARCIRAARRASARRRRRRGRRTRERSRSAG